MRALDYALDHNVNGIKMSSILQNVDLAKKQADDVKAAMIIKRLHEVKKFDDEKVESVPGYRPIILEE